MGGGCACHSSIKKCFYNSADYILKSEHNYINDNDKNNQKKIPEKNIKIIPRNDFRNSDNIKINGLKNSDKTKAEINKNNVSNDIHDSSNYNKENKRNFTCDNINDNSNLNLISENSKKNNNEIDNQANKSFNKNGTQNNDNEKHNIIQKKILGNNDNDFVKKAETNYNYNLGEHNFIFINISRGSSIAKNDEKMESTTPKMAFEKGNFDDIPKGNKRISHFFKNNINEKPSKKQSGNNIRDEKRQEKENIRVQNYMINYSEEMLKTLNLIRKNPIYFIQYIDEVINNNIQTKNDEVFIVSKIIDEKVKLMDNYLNIFEKIKDNLKEIINSKIFERLEEFKYNEELEIILDKSKDFLLKESHMSSLSNRSDSKYNSNINNQIIKNKRMINSNSLDLSDDKIANLILGKRKQIKNKYPESVFKLNIIKDIQINILIQISMEFLCDQFCGKKLLKEILFDSKYKYFASSWANEINRKFITISCFA